jgi:glyceraldehyde 3-phosphate dehydrogenase
MSNVKNLSTHNCMNKIKVGINGFGRIGRAFTRIALNNPNIEVVAVNTRSGDLDLMMYGLKYDSIYRKYNKDVTRAEGGMQVGTQFIANLQGKTPEEIPWDKYGVDIVVDATGAFMTTEDCKKHINGSVKKVLMTGPAKDASATVVMGVNNDKINWKEEVVLSNASCTTNCSAPMFKVIQDTFGILTGYLTTTHAYTNTQALLDEGNKTKDRSRAAALNTAPSTTGAAKAVGLVIPELKGKMDGMSVRVPVPVVSFTDLSIVVEKEATKEAIHAAFAEYAAKNPNILRIETDMLVSSDFIADTHSCIFDSNYTKVMGGHLVKIFGWYDNEWGFSNRLVDVVNKWGENLS